MDDIFILETRKLFLLVTVTENKAMIPFSHRTVLQEGEASTSSSSNSLLWMTERLTAFGVASLCGFTSSAGRPCQCPEQSAKDLAPPAPQP